MNKYYNEIEKWFITLYNQCIVYYNKEQRIKHYHHNKNYILKEKLYRITCKNKPKKIFYNSDIIFITNYKLK